MSIYEDAFQERGFYRHQESTDFSENYRQALGTAIESDLSISRFIAGTMSPYRTQRNEQLDKLLADGKLPEDYSKMLGEYMTYNELAIIARDRFGLQVRSDDDIDNAIRDDIKRNAAEAAKTASQATFSGKVGAFTGAMHAAMLDPVGILGSFTGLGVAARGATVLQRVGSAMTVGAAATAAEEAVIQPFVYNWKQDVGLDYNIDDALKNIAFATAGGSVLAGAAKTAGEFATQGRKFLSSHPTARARDADPALAEAHKNLDSRVREAEQLPPDTDIKEHFNQVDGYINRTDSEPPSGKIDFNPEDATDEVVDGLFKTEAEDTVFVRDVIDEGSGKRTTVIGNAVEEVDAINKQMDSLSKFDNCLKGV